MSACRTLFRPRSSQNEMASGAKSTPTFLSSFPSCFRIAPVPQPASRIAFSGQSGSSLSRVSKIRRCRARYHQCVCSTRNMISYSDGFTGLRLRHKNAQTACRLRVGSCHDKSVAEHRYQTGSVSLLASGNGRVCLGVGMYHIAHDVLWRASLIQI